MIKKLGKKIMENEVNVRNLRKSGKQIYYSDL